jgi:hypothetical protein
MKLNIAFVILGQEAMLDYVTSASQDILDNARGKTDY